MTIDPHTTVLPPLLGAPWLNPDAPVVQCATTDPEVFFVDNWRNAEQVRTAKQVCRGCPLTHACLEFALTNCAAGVWGGTTEPERQQMRRAGAA